MKHLGLVAISLMLFAGCGTANVDAPVDNAPSITQEVQDTTPVEEKITMEEKTTQSDLSRALPNHKDLAAIYSGAIIKTNKGDLTVTFYAEESPITVNNFLNLANDGFYDGIKFHRIIKDFMIQGGDPNSKEEDRMMHGSGGPGYKFGDEFNSKKIVRGSLAMANAGPATNGSQFFIVTASATPHLDGMHTNFGQITDGMDIVDIIENVETDRRDNPIEPVEILSIELIAK